MNYQKKDCLQTVLFVQNRKDYKLEFKRYTGFDPVGKTKFNIETD